MMRGERMLPLSENHGDVLVFLSTGILPDAGGLKDQDADFVDDLQKTRAEMSRQAAQRMRDRRFELGR